METEEEECDTQDLSRFFFSVLFFNITDKGERFETRSNFLKVNFKEKYETSLSSMNLILFIMIPVLKSWMFISQEDYFCRWRLERGNCNMMKSYGWFLFQGDWTLVKKHLEHRQSKIGYLKRGNNKQHKEHLWAEESLQTKHSLHRIEALRVVRKDFFWLSYGVVYLLLSP